MAVHDSPDVIEDLGAGEAEDGAPKDKQPSLDMLSDLEVQINLMMLCIPNPCLKYVLASTMACHF